MNENTRPVTPGQAFPAEFVDYISGRPEVLKPGAIPTLVYLQLQNRWLAVQPVIQLAASEAPNNCTGVASTHPLVISAIADQSGANAVAVLTRIVESAASDVSYVEVEALLQRRGDPTPTSLRWRVDRTSGDVASEPPLQIGASQHASLIGTASAPPPFSGDNTPEDQWACAQSVSRALRAAGETRPIRFDTDEFSLLIGAGDGEVSPVYLRNLYGEAALAPPAAREGMVQNHVSAILTILRGGLPESRDDVERGLLPKVVSRATQQLREWEVDAETANGTPGSGKGSMPAYILVGEHLTIELAVDTEKVIMGLSRDELEKLELTFARGMQIAVQHLQGRSGHDFPNNFVRTATGLYVSPWSDFYDPSRIIFGDQLERLVAPDELVVMAPHRQVLLAAAAGNAAALLEMCERTASMFPDPRFISAIPLVWRDGSWQTYTPLPSSSAFEQFRELQLRTLHGEYANQRVPLQRLRPRGQGIFISSYMVRQAPGATGLTSYAAWTSGLCSLLPRAERLNLIDSDGRRVVCYGSAPWEHFERFLGHLLEPMHIYPERYRVSTFPTTAQRRRLNLVHHDGRPAEQPMITTLTEEDIRRATQMAQEHPE